MSAPEPPDHLARVEHASRMRTRGDARRALARRERHMRRRARVDLALGVILALLVVLLAPGLAIVALLVLLALVVLLVWWLIRLAAARRGGRDGAGRRSPPGRTRE
jgi:Flp pilus assembly protein TadB